MAEERSCGWGMFYRFLSIARCSDSSYLCNWKLINYIIN